MQNFFSSKSKISSECDDVIWDERRLSFHKELIKSILIQKKLKKSDIIILVSNQRAIFFSSLFAIWELGFCAACISPSTTKSELKNIIKKTGSRVIINYKIKSSFYKELEIDCIDTKNLKKIQHTSVNTIMCATMTRCKPKQKQPQIHGFAHIHAYACRMRLSDAQGLWP